MAYADTLRTTTFTASDIASLIDGLAFGIDAWGGASGGTANALTATLSATPASLLTGLTVTFYASTTNTASATLAVNGLTATTIYDARTGAALIGGEIFATGVYTCVYYNTKFYLINGRPGMAVWAPTVGGFSANPTSTNYQYARDGNLITVWVRQGAAGTSNAGTFTLTAPVTAATISNGLWSAKVTSATNNSAVIDTAIVYISTGGSTITIDRDASGTAWTSSGAKKADFTLTYPAA